MRRWPGQIRAAAFAVLLAANPAAILHARAAQDAAASDESANVDGVPAWIFGAWCSAERPQPATRWEIGRDHGADFRASGDAHPGTWSVVRLTPPRDVELEVDHDPGQVRLIFRRANEDDPSRDVMYSAGMYYDRCGATDVDARS